MYNLVTWSDWSMALRSYFKMWPFSVGAKITILWPRPVIKHRAWPDHTTCLGCQIWARSGHVFHYRLQSPDQTPARGTAKFLLESFWYYLHFLIVRKCFRSKVSALSLLLSKVICNALLRELGCWFDGNLVLLLCG